MSWPKCPVTETAQTEKSCSVSVDKNKLFTGDMTKLCEICADYTTYRLELSCDASHWAKLENHMNFRKLFGRCSNVQQRCGPDQENFVWSQQGMKDLLQTKSQVMTFVKHVNIWCFAI